MDGDLLRRIVELARLAPSVHNTQPWTWTIDGTTLELYADRSRALPMADPDGRNLVISCGAAVHHAVVAAQGLGLEPTVEYVPERAGSDLLARIRLTDSQPTPESVGRLATLGARRTDRRRFTSWPVPDENLQHLADEGGKWGARVLAVTDPGLRLALEELLEDARRRQLADPRIADETETWIDHGTSDGIPSEALPHLERARGERPTRYGSSLVSDTSEAIIHGTDGLLVISTSDDGPASRLRAGAALSALWLRATANGLSIVPLSQVVEVERTRESLERLLPGSERVPQILARVGWQEIGRDALASTPRRPLGEVLREG
jgi:hypothetical protein